MKSYFSLILFLIVEISFGQKDYSKNYKLIVEKIESSIIENRKFINLKVTLTNNSKDTLHYMGKSCSWQDFYSTNNAKVNIESPNCDKNVPKFLSLAPKESKSVMLKIDIEKNLVIRDIKIGFNIVESKEMDFDVHDPIAVNAEKIWSNNLDLK